MGELGVFTNWFGLASWLAADRDTLADAAKHAPGALRIRASHRYAVAGKTTFSLESDFQVLPGVTILRGHSGAGKTTLLRCVAGLADLRHGYIAIGEQVLFDSHRQINLPPRYRNIAFVFQNLALFPHLRVRENVAYGLRKLSAATRAQRVGSVTEAFRIAHLAERLPREISGGEQQRVALARALVTEPSALLLDEPLSSLDVRTKALIIEDLRAWNAVHHIPILYVTHDAEEARALGERVITLEHGRIAADASLREVPHSAPAHCARSVSSFQNYFEAIVVGVEAATGTVRCRVHSCGLELRVRATNCQLGSTVRIAVHAGIIPQAAAAPADSAEFGAFARPLEPMDAPATPVPD